MTDKPNTAEPYKPRRRWFQFRLRTLLVDVVVIGGVFDWFGISAWQAHQRASMIHRIRQMYGIVRLAGDQAIDPQSTPAVSWIRRLLGDREVAEIDLPVQTNAAERQQIKEAFPEATILAVRFPIASNRSGEAQPEDYPQFFPFPDTAEK